MSSKVGILELGTEKRRNAIRATNFSDSISLISDEGVSERWYHIAETEEVDTVIQKGAEKAECHSSMRFSFKIIPKDDYLPTEQTLHRTRRHLSNQAQSWLMEKRKSPSFLPWGDEDIIGPDQKDPWDVVSVGSSTANGTRHLEVLEQGLEWSGPFTYPREETDSYKESPILLVCTRVNVSQTSQEVQAELRRIFSDV